MAQEMKLTKEHDCIEARLSGPQVKTVAALDARDLCKKINRSAKICSYS